MRRFGVSNVISTGNEAVLDTTAFIEALIEDRHTAAIACFTETVRSPERFVAALDLAADRGKPVIVLKVGRGERTRRAIATHTGGLAGGSRVFTEVLKRHRAIEVADFDELVETLAALQSSKIPQGRRIAVLTGSGGQAELALDVVSEAEIILPPLDPTVRTDIERVVGPITGDGNPVDVWGKGQWLANVAHAVKTLDAHRAADAVAICFDFNDANPMGAPDRFVGYAETLNELVQSTAVPVFHLNSRSGLFHQELVKDLAQNGIAALGGLRQGLYAIDALARARAPAGRTRLVPPKVDIGASGLLDEVKSKALLRPYGIPVVREVMATTPQAAIEAARSFGYPVVLKAVAEGMAHKSDLGGVVLGIRDDAALRIAWDRTTENIGRGAPNNPPVGCVVQPMITGGVEVFAGVSRDPEFGLVLAVGLGGVLIDVIRDFSLRPLPLMEGDAAAMIEQLQARAVFDGVRGAPPVDVAALVACLEAVADFAMAHADQLVELDLNPIILLPEGRGCVVVDAIIAMREMSRG
jgi:acetate---CoA ligase (ADP-forming)